MADRDAVEKYISDETVETLQQKIDLIENLKIKPKERKILSEKHVSQGTVYENIVLLMVLLLELWLLQNSFYK
jgi:hypothetical protein